MSPFTHISIQPVPQRLDENFASNADKADQQKRLAEAAPDLLHALFALEHAIRRRVCREDGSCSLEMDFRTEAEATNTRRLARDAIIKAIGSYPR